MPELPDVTVYVESLASKVVGVPLHKIRIANPFVLRTYDPKPAAFEGLAPSAVRRLGKRIVFAFAGDNEPLFAVVHLMVLGRFKWAGPAAKIPGRVGLFAMNFADGTLLLTEQGTKRRASLHLVRGEEGLRAFDRGGLEPLAPETTPKAFFERLLLENHTLKRTLTDPRLFSGIGNAYSDEILHAAGLSPVKLSQKTTEEERQRLYDATKATLLGFTDRLRDEARANGGFPEKVTAFRDEMAVHGKFGAPCPRCGTKVQRIVYAENETNYCPGCQTGGKLLADRSLSRLLRDDWPKSLDELEEQTAERREKLGLGER